MRPLDPITLAVIQAALGQVCNEMDIAFSRSAFSPVIAEAEDRSVGHLRPGDGRADQPGRAGPAGVRRHHAVFHRRVIRLIGEPRPVAGARRHLHRQRSLSRRHAPDGRAFALPFYYRGEQFCWLQNTGHWPDIGGMVPGGFSANATEVEQEGLRLPPVKLFKRGGMDGRSSAILNSNMRIAEQRIGDIKAQAAALKIGERRLTELIDRYGRDTVVEAAIAEIRARAAQLMRAHIAAIPDGVYRSRGLRRLRRRRQRAAENRTADHARPAKT